MSAADISSTVTSLGLSSAEVEAERAQGRVNTQPNRTSRSYAGIIRGNVFTRFNAIIATLAVVVLVVGDPIDAIFGMVMVFNTVIGIVQEGRAKRTLDRLRILITPTVTAIRDGEPADVPSDQLVCGDVIHLRSGDQVPVDGDVVEATGFDVDESALTGEADAITKRTGENVRSGSVVVGGSAVVRATAVGEATWIYQLLLQAKEFALATSDLRLGVDQILRIVSWLIVPVSALVLWSQLRDDEDLGEGLVSAVAGVVGLVPQGLVLLVSMALAVAVIRLAKNHVIVQELHAVEGLARIDVLCLDKTGTLTTGSMTLDRIETLGGPSEPVTEALAALAACESTTSSTLSAAAGETVPPDWSLVSAVSFNSARKWSGASFEPGGTWLVGAPEVMLEGAAPDSVADARQRITELAEDARRVLLVARSGSTLPDEQDGNPDDRDLLPGDLEPVALVVLAEEVRPDAAETMRYFGEQHVILKVISGDNPVTVSAVAQRLGVEGAEHHVDMREVDLAGPPAEIDALVEGTTIFGRVMPQQKRELVEILQRRGHTVAMTGDGVNDIPALKKADIGIAMDTATAATKAVSQLVLLDGRFDRLPAVVAEGRRVFTNMERVSALFVTKTVYSAVFAIVIGIWGATFPFLPRHVSLISEVSIGLPAFALSFRAADAPYRPGYLRRVLRFAVPAGLATATVVLVGYALVRSPLTDATTDEARTASTLMLLVIAFWILYLLTRPIDRFDALVLTGVVVLTGLIVGTPPGRRFYGIDWPDSRTTSLIGGYVLAAVAGLWIVLAVVRRRAPPPAP